jgi:isochorismate pyruvate lyase
MRPANRCKTINEVREAIDCIDQKIIQLLAHRYGYVKEVVRFKEPTEDSVVAQSRLDAVISSRRALAKKNGLNPDVIEKIYRELINYFISEEKKILHLK